MLNISHSALMHLMVWHWESLRGGQFVNGTGPSFLCPLCCCIPSVGLKSLNAPKMNSHSPLVVTCAHCSAFSCCWLWCWKCPAACVCIVMKFEKHQLLDQTQKSSGSIMRWCYWNLLFCSFCCFTTILHTEQKQTVFMICFGSFFSTNWNTDSVPGVTLTISAVHYFFNALVFLLIFEIIHTVMWTFWWRGWKQTKTLIRCAFLNSIVVFVLL